MELLFGKVCVLIGVVNPSKVHQSVLVTAVLLASTVLVCGQTNYRVFILTQTNFPNSTGFGISFGQMVGLAYGTNARPVLWHGSFTEAIDLVPPGYLEPYTAVSAVWGGEQVGYGGVGSIEQGARTHALLWHGSAESAIDLHPQGFSSSEATDVYDGVQVGVADSGAALLWRGTAASVVNLNPTSRLGQATPYSGCWASCVAGNFQGGHATYYSSDDLHAVRWRGTAASMVDLHPPNGPYSDTFVLGIDHSGIAVGTGWIPLASYPQPNPPKSIHALLWRGGATNYVDLHPLGFQIS